MSAWQYFVREELQMIREQHCTFSCTGRIVEAAVSDSPPDLPITDMQSGFPQLFCSAGLGFSFTHCIRCQKNKGVSVYCARQKKKKIQIQVSPPGRLHRQTWILSSSVPPALFHSHFSVCNTHTSGRKMLKVEVYFPLCSHMAHLGVN